MNCSFTGALVISFDIKLEMILSFLEIGDSNNYLYSDFQIRNNLLTLRYMFKHSECYLPLIYFPDHELQISIFKNKHLCCICALVLYLK